MIILREINRIIIHHTASVEGLHTWDEIRSWHTTPIAEGGKHGWRDIGYHAGIVRDGADFAVANGRPFDEQGAHAKGANVDSIGVCFEGNFEHELLHRRQLDVGVALITSICLRYHIDPLASVFGHRDVGTTATVCPGKFFPLDELRGRVADAMRWLP